MKYKQKHFQNYDIKSNPPPQISLKKKERFTILYMNVSTCIITNTKRTILQNSKFMNLTKRQIHKAYANANISY